MKKLFITLVAGLIVLTTSFAFPTSVSKDHPKYDLIEANLIKGLKSGNNGLMFSSAMMLGDMQSERAITELNKILRDFEDESVKIAAALALTKIGTERSIFLVKQQSRFNDNEKVAKLCEKFYMSFIQNQLVHKQHNNTELASL